MKQEVDINVSPFSDVKTAQHPQLFPWSTLSTVVQYLGKCPSCSMLLQSYLKVTGNASVKTQTTAPMSTNNQENPVAGGDHIPASQEHREK